MKARRGLAAVVGAIVVVGAMTACDPRSLVVTTTTQAPPPPPPAATVPSQSSTPSVSTSSPRPKRTQAAGCQPASLSIRSVGITGSVKPTGLNRAGELEPPAQQIVWYDRSVLPGQDGISVIAGHVTYGPPDKFYTLRNVKVGASVSIRCHDGSTLVLKVTRTQAVSKAALTKDPRVWGTSSTPVVALITCDKDTAMVAGHHLGNWVVWAIPTRK